uniref:OTU domain-containing protein n=1 Tax=Branchiostoma floridae TaxID=7739 RepID=C3ZXP5_BRAFL|eukprot:XP_002586697.1 hypothetical protein BRAFLDRAFT_105503 [Branchiostoma floridae]
MSKTCSHVVIEHPQEDNGYGNDDMQQMKANLAAENLVVRDFITADGNCQFSAVSDQVSRLKRGYMTANCLREIVVSYLKNIPVPEEEDGPVSSPWTVSTAGKGSKSRKRKQNMLWDLSSAGTAAIDDLTTDADSDDGRIDRGCVVSQAKGRQVFGTMLLQPVKQYSNRPKCKRSFDSSKLFEEHLSVEHHHQHIPPCRKFDWVILRVGKLHLEMNAMKAYVDLHWNVRSSALAEEMGFYV